MKVFCALQLEMPQLQSNQQGAKEAHASNIFTVCSFLTYLPYLLWPVPHSLACGVMRSASVHMISPYARISSVVDVLETDSFICLLFLLP